MTDSVDGTRLPGDSHVHSEWSWDALNGAMQASCRRAVELGLPAIAFTEHLDHTVWTVDTETLDPGHPFDPYLQDDQIHPPAFDAIGYLAAIEDCRDRFPGLTVLSGLELGEPHWHPDAVAAVLRSGSFDRLLGSLHSLPYGNSHAEPPLLYVERAPADVLRDYLVEITRLVTSDQPFEILAHIDYPIRYWPADVAPFDPLDFEDEFRHALRTTAESGRALEFSTVIPLDRQLLQWWYDEGGAAISFASDAHDPAAVARGFRAAADLAESIGYHPAPDVVRLWHRH